jgi:hypothetical protein
MRAALVVGMLCSACIGEVVGGDDPGDMPDDPPPPPPKATKLTASDGVLPRANINVLFQAPDGGVVADTVTDSAGIATAMLPAGGMVTAIVKQPGTSDHVFTYLGVEPGDELVLVRPYGGDMTTTRTIDVTVGFEDGTAVAIRTPCGSGTGASPTIRVTLGPCASEIDFYVESQGNEQDSFLAKAMVADVVDLRANTARGALSTQLIASNVPMQATIALTKRLEQNGFVFFSVAGAQATSELDVADVPGTEQVVTAQITTLEGTQLIAQRDAYEAFPSMFDVGASLLPFANAAMLAASQLTWTEVGTGTPDTVRVDIAVERTTVKFNRYVAGAYAGTMLALPSLPAPYDTYNVGATDTYTLQPTLVKVTGGYDQARARIMNGDPSNVAPKTGQATAARGAPTSMRP